MRVMALDIGEVRTGIAISDPARRVATPLCVFPTRELLHKAASFVRMLQDWEPSLLLCGLPYTLQGQQGAQAKRTYDVALRIGQLYELPIHCTDERLSSQQAKRILREKGFTEREMRGKTDMIAASLFLQTWLDTHCSDER